MDPIIDLRSDTVTHPTPAMRDAMYRAEVGDDVLGEDPTINRLEQIAAQKMGKQAGLFVPSGTMGNLAAVLAHCQRGEEAIMGHLGHTFLFEAGGISALGGVFANTLRNQPDGSMQLDDIRSSIRGADIHQPVTRLVILENTHNRCGGAVLPVAYIENVKQLTTHYGIQLHLDGARIFNAAAALGIQAEEIAKHVDSVTFCLSKGLCAPVGSVLCGTDNFVTRARRIRKQLGGGMRQAGILAAAGIVALEQMIDRIGEDNRRAYHLAEKLAEIPGLELPMGKPQSNMVFVQLKAEYPLDAAVVAGRMKEHGVRVGVVGSRIFRLVLHYWIDDHSVDQTAETFRRVL